MPKKPTNIFAKKVNPTGVYNQESLIKAIHSMRKEIHTEQISNVTGSNPFVSSMDDLSDVSIYHQRKSPASVTEYTLLDVSDGPKTCMAVGGTGGALRNTAGDYGRVGPVTVDGTSNSAYPANQQFEGQDNGGDSIKSFIGFPFIYDLSLKVEWEHAGTGNRTSAYAFILGSGPHSIAVVQDGEPVYMTAGNVGEYQIENLNVPKGYKIVRNPDITHPDPQNKGMWDDSKGEVVDHPYKKPFHKTLDRLNEAKRTSGVKPVLDRIEANRSEIGSKTKPVKEAIQNWVERESKKLSSSDIPKEL